MDRLAAFYFSGTGNTKYVTERLCAKLSEKWWPSIFDVCQANDFSDSIIRADRVLLAFPVYGSSPPIPMRQFIYRHKKLWQNKVVMIVATQYMFSGDGAAGLGRTLERFGARVEFAEHINMPNNLADCKMFKIRNDAALRKTMAKADRRIDAFAAKILQGRPSRRGFNVLSHAVGYFCQRRWWRKGESQKRKQLKISSLCSGCGLCAENCPVGNIRIENGKARAAGNCALCYRCINLCPRRAITLFGAQPPAEQYKGVPPHNE